MAQLWCVVGCVMLTCTSACSGFTMENDYQLSVRTIDFGSTLGATWTVATIPKGNPGLRSSKHGYIGYIVTMTGTPVDDLVFAGLNDAGVTCDLLTLHEAVYPNSSATKDNIDAGSICRWVLEGFGSVAEVKDGLQSVQFITPKMMPIGGAHWAIRDAAGEGLVFEFLEGKMQVYVDDNDQGKTGFGLMTNSPPLQWQNENVRHLQWKQSMARSAVTMPGSWYSDERFLRIHLVKSAMPKPKSFEEAMMQAVHTLNTITVPMGNQIGLDGKGDRTQFGVVYDRKNKAVYWRTLVNQNLQRLRLQDVAMKGKRYLDVFSPKLPWFNDASGLLSPQAEPSAAHVAV